MCLAVLSNLLNLMRGGTSGTGAELSWEDSMEFVWVDKNLEGKQGTSAAARWNKLSLESPSIDAKPLLDSNFVNASVLGKFLICLRK